jgi:hypothetical protein
VLSIHDLGRRETRKSASRRTKVTTRAYTTPAHVLCAHRTGIYRPVRTKSEDRKLSDSKCRGTVTDLRWEATEFLPFSRSGRGQSLKTSPKVVRNSIYGLYAGMSPEVGAALRVAEPDDFRSDVLSIMAGAESGWTPARYREGSRVQPYPAVKELKAKRRQFAFLIQWDCRLVRVHCDWGVEKWRSQPNGDSVALVNARLRNLSTRRVFDFIFAAGRLVPSRRTIGPWRSTNLLEGRKVRPVDTPIASPMASQHPSWRKSDSSPRPA